MNLTARQLSTEELVAEVTRRLLEAPVHGGAAPRGQPAIAASTLATRRRLVAELQTQLLLAAAEGQDTTREPEEPSAAAAAATPPVPAEWIEKAREAGSAARDYLAGTVRALPRLERSGRYPAKKFFVVLRAAPQVEAELRAARRPATGIVHGCFAEAEGYVSEAGSRGTLATEAVFCGFHSEAEAVEYWGAAFPDVDLLRLPRRRFR